MQENLFVVDAVVGVTDSKLPLKPIKSVMLYFQALLLHVLLVFVHWFHFFKKYMEHTKDLSSREN